MKSGNGTGRKESSGTGLPATRYAEIIKIMNSKWRSNVMGWLRAVRRDTKDRVLCIPRFLTVKT